MNLLRKLSGHPLGAERSITTVEDYLSAIETFGFGGNTYGLGQSSLQTTMNNQQAERIPTDFRGMASQMFGHNSVIFACILARFSVFSSARFQYQRFNAGRPSELFGDQSLSLFERPWEGGTTQDLLARMMIDADLAGNSYWTVWGGEMVRLRPDWVDIVLEPRIVGPAQPYGGPDRGPQVMGWRKLGFLYHEGGHGESEPVPLLYGDVAHYAPIPDPLANYRGMSWLTPLIRETSADDLMTRHKTRFMENAAPQPLDAAILTPRGWSTMGAMTVGSEVIGSDGKAHRVTGVYPQGEQSIYRVSFSDGAEVECTSDHVWSVQSAYDVRKGTLRDLTLAELVEGGLRFPGGTAKWSIPFVDPVEYANPGPLPVDPYLLGLLLGDGSFRENGKGSGGVSLAADARDVEQTASDVAGLLPDGVKVSRRDRGGWSELYLAREPGCGYRTNRITEAIRGLGLWNVAGPDKFVPDAYLRGSVTERLRLLQGLLDSDGSVDTRQPNLVRFTNRSRALADAVGELARSLGGTATVTEVPARSQWVVTVRRLPHWMIPFRLARKVETYRVPTGRAVRHRYITGVEYVGRKPAQCIRVETPDSLYVTDGFVLTHNTPNLVVKHHESVTQEQIEKFAKIFDSKHRGSANTGRTMHLGGGADATVVGANFQELEFSTTQAAGETRIAAAAGVPPVIVGLSKGLESSTYSNYSQARRRFADGTLSPLWQNAAGTLQQIRPAPAGARLWYDTRDVPFLREDEKDAAEIAEIQARTMRVLVDGGFDPDTVLKFMAAGATDWALLKHSGLLSVQLQPPGSVAGAPATAPATAPPAKPAAKPDTAKPATKTPAKRADDPDPLPVIPVPVFPG